MHILVCVENKIKPVGFQSIHFTWLIKYMEPHFKLFVIYLMCMKMFRLHLCNLITNPILILISYISENFRFVQLYIVRIRNLKKLIIEVLIFLFTF